MTMQLNTNFILQWLVVDTNPSDMVVDAEINPAEWLVAAWEPAGVVNFTPTTILLVLVSILPYNTLKTILFD